MGRVLLMIIAFSSLSAGALPQEQSRSFKGVSNVDCEARANSNAANMSPADSVRLVSAVTGDRAGSSRGATYQQGSGAR